MFPSSSNDDESISVCFEKEQRQICSTNCTSSNYDNNKNNNNNNNNSNSSNSKCNRKERLCLYRIVRVKQQQILFLLLLTLSTMVFAIVGAGSSFSNPIRKRNQNNILNNNQNNNRNNNRNSMEQKEEQQLGRSDNYNDGSNGSGSGSGSGSDSVNSRSSTFLRQSDHPYLYDKDIDQWTSIAHTVEFLPAHSIDSWKNKIKMLSSTFKDQQNEEEILNSGKDKGTSTIDQNISKEEEKEVEEEDNATTNSNSINILGSDDDEFDTFLLDSPGSFDDDGDGNEDIVMNFQKQQQQEPIYSYGGTSSSSTTSQQRRMLSDDTSTYNSYSSSAVYEKQPFVSASNIEYDSYQQAWRLLGFMIDCDGGSSSSNNYNNDDNKNRDNNNKNNNNQLTGEGCQRYVIWAAYVDVEYEGGGIGEYQYWDRQKKAWDTTSCRFPSSNNNNNNNKNNNNNNNNNKNNQNSSGKSRCAKMDCHLPDTNWKLLGIFKHKSLDDWMGQLFKHEGMCLWSDDEYSFMKNARKAWPSGCSISQTTTNDGQIIYYDVKPTSGGGITLGLYTDTKCTEEYRKTNSHDPITVENVLGNILLNAGSHDSRDNNNNNNNNNNNYNNEDSTFEETLSYWDSAFDVFKICQPCVAYDINNWGYGNNDDAVGSAYGTYRYGYNDDYAWKYWGYYTYSGNNFDCYDDAGYTNVNQCMKFMAKTTMNTATFRDLSLANLQGTLVENPLSGYRDGTLSSLSSSYSYSATAHIVLMEYLILCTSLFICFYGIYKYVKVVREANRPVEVVSSKTPLVLT